MNSDWTDPRRPARGRCGLVIAAALTVLAAGCRPPGDTGGAQPQAALSQADAEQQIQQIQADPHMPEFAKKMSINTIRQRAGMPTAINGPTSGGSGAPATGAAPSPAS
jgi:hypothetical protein